MKTGRNFLSTGVTALALLDLLPVTARADSTLYVTPSVSVGRMYDDNLFFTPSDRQSSALWRVSPALEGGYLSEPLTLAGYYTVDAERYATHPELDGNTVRRDAAVDFTSKPSERLDLTADAGYISTDTPAELALGTGLGFGRTRARVYTADPSLSYRFDSLTTGKAGFDYEKDALAGAFDTYVRTATLGLDHATSERATWSLDYAFTDYGFPGAGANSRVLTLGLAYELTPETKVTLAAGPRDTDGETRPEISASLRQSYGQSSLYLDYARSQATVLGQATPVDTRTYLASLDWFPLPLFEVLIAPSYVRESSGGSQAGVYRFGLNASYKLSHNVSAVCTYQYNRGHGVLGGPSDEVIVDNVIFLGLVFSFPGDTGSAFAERQSSPFETLWPVPRH